MDMITISGRKPARSVWFAGVALLLFALPIAAFAELGGDAASVQADQARMKATLKTTQAEAYTVHEIQAPSGTAVREYVSPAGKVFAVAWRGPFLPDLHQILGASFTTFTQSVQAQRMQRSGHGPVLVKQDALVVKSLGHARNYFGKAYLPELVPQGVQDKDIR
ncbi:MAG: DUF2844 domain-containing protein [Terriglobales bacterium]